MSYGAGASVKKDANFYNFSVLPHTAPQSPDFGDVVGTVREWGNCQN